MRSAILAIVFLGLSGCVSVPQPTWALTVTQLDELPKSLSADGVVIAILDTGIDLGHPALRHLQPGQGSSSRLLGFQDFVAGSKRPVDEDGHGTFTAGVLVGGGSRLHPRSGVSGLTPGADLLVARVCRADQCDFGALADALAWAVDAGADVVHFGIGFDPQEASGTALRRLQEQLARAHDAGVILIAAAGNTGPVGGVLYPAADARVVAVGALDREVHVRASSARGTEGKPDLLAPGQGIVGPDARGGRIQFDGTSAAAPFATAVAAFAFAQESSERDASHVERLRAALRMTARPIDGQEVPWDRAAGYGVLQARDALRWYQTTGSLT